jgi:hypothetical protein
MIRSGAGIRGSSNLSRHPASEKLPVIGSGPGKASVLSLHSKLSSRSQRSSLAKKFLPSTEYRPAMFAFVIGMAERQPVRRLARTNPTESAAVFIVRGAV